MAQHIEVGKRGEELAEAYLRKQGYKILGRNVANPLGKRLGEIDIVAEKAQEIIFVEVKTLAGSPYLPEWQVTRSKLQKMERIAGFYLRNNGLMERSYRFDVIAITLWDGKEPDIRHIECAFL
ncbi:MAG: YraN family protein [Candidatus Moraniibacteriota bacterium]|nr:MAG: YraN family protein [Candidatus Moranbacteria bacterium]